MDNYRVSVIVTIYNVEKYLCDCVESIIKQTYKNLEIILVDDGSKDNSGRICDDFADKNSNIKVFHKTNGGLVSAWTEGLKHSTAEWVIFVDGDDWIEPYHIEFLVAEQIKNSSDIVVTSMKQVDSMGEKYIPFVMPADCYKGAKLTGILHPVMINAGGFEKRGVPFSRCSKLIRKTLMEQNIKYLYSEATYEEDFNIMAPTLMDAKSISLIDVENAAYCYRRVEESMLHGYSTKMKSSVDNIYPRLFEACREKNFNEFVPQLESEYVSAKVRQYTNELRNPAGIRAIRTNIANISQDSNLRIYMQKGYDKNYPRKFKLVTYALKNYGTLMERMITIMLFFISKNLK